MADGKWIERLRAVAKAAPRNGVLNALIEVYGAETYDQASTCFAADIEEAIKPRRQQPIVLR